MKTLINEFQTAAAQLDEKRRALHRAAAQRRDELAGQLCDDAQRRALVDMIDNMIEQADEATRTAAPLKIQQFTASIVHPSVKAGDGAVLLDVFIDAARGYTDSRRYDALQACLLMASGRVEAGLFNFSKPYHDRLTLATLDAFAGIIDAARHKRYTAHRAALLAEQAEAARLAELIAAPVVITLEPETAAPETIAIRYSEEQTPLVAAGVALKGYGTVNHVTREQFDRLQGSPLYAAGVQCGSIEVMP
ncbi:hypothetical protein [Sedimenticola hydrogenitrophicus]|uniref:hypothetical protein n=1 Tax=Sedimenticola hydrogenitrophicus TaxID=2967975 RepID=UPI0023B18ED2|nr:hypothetical protein [Sedimenticola hydrogenitrophicus]